MATSDYLIVLARKGVWHKTNPFSRLKRYLSEGLISDYAEKMDLLREVDDQISTWTDDLDSLVKGAERSLKNSRLVDLALYLNQINQRLVNVETAGKKLKEVSEKALNEFEKETELGIPLDGAFSADDGLESSAGFLDNWKRQWLADKLRNKTHKERNFALKNLVNFSRNTVGRVQDVLEHLAKARHTGEIGEYIQELSKISELQQKFQATFQPVFKTYLKPLVDEVITKEQEQRELKNTVKEELDRKPDLGTLDPEVDTHRIPMEELKTPDLPIPQEPVVQAPPPELGTLDFPEDHPTTSAKPTKEAPITQPSNSELFPELTPRQKSSPIPKIEKYEDTPVAEPTEYQKEIEEGMKAASTILQLRAHRNFIVELVKAAKQDDPYLLANMLISYAGKIEDSNLSQSLKLVALAEGIIDR